MRIYKARSGFTMLELSIVIIIIAIITGMGTVATLGLVESAKQAATEKKLDEIERALQNFRLKNNRLPCPASLTLATSDTNYGLEGQPLGGCATGTPAAAWVDNYGAEGTVPVRTLGLPDGFMYDGWGRKIRYMVDINATYVDAFTAIKPKEFCEITILDNVGGTAITGNADYENGAIYALLSHGSNGHGGYTETGAIVNSGSADGSEQINCRCDATSANVDALEHANYVQKETTSTFDDIVRYKERWQMQSEEDAKLLATSYMGPDMAISLTQNGSNNVKFFERQCGQLKEFPGSEGVDLPANYASTSATVGLAFTQNNDYVFAYNDDADCDLYAISSGGAVGPGDTGSTVIDCSTFGAAPAIDMSSNGYLVVALTAAISNPYARLWRFSNGKFLQAPDTSPAEVFGTVAAGDRLTGYPTGIAVSKNGNYIAFTRNIAATYTTVYYKNSSGTYTRIGTPSGGGFAPPATLMAFSDDETMLAISKAATVFIWSINKANNTLTYVTSKAGTATITAMDFSPDGKYFAVVGGGPVNGSAYNSKFNIYKIDALSSADISVITPGSAFSYGGTAFTDVAFSADSNYLVMPFTGGASDQRATVFRRTGASTFQEVKGADGTSRPLAFTLNAGESPRLVRFAQ